MFYLFSLIVDTVFDDINDIKTLQIIEFLLVNVDIDIAAYQ